MNLSSFFNFGKNTLDSSLPNRCDTPRVSLTNPKSGKESERIFLPSKVAERLKADFINKEIRPDGRVFPILYSTARVIVKKVDTSSGFSRDRQ